MSHCSHHISFRYTTTGGAIAAVPRIVRPYEVLQIDQNAPREVIKEAYKKVANRPRRQDRVMASLSYCILMSKVQRYGKISDESYEIVDGRDVIVLTAIGATTTLLALISKDNSLLEHIDEHDHTVLYLAARSGFYDTTEALLNLGVPVNKVQVDGSTPLHAASFYGQRIIVELLLRYGADPTIKNRWNNTPADEAKSCDIKQVILTSKEDRISQFVSSQIAKRGGYRVHLIKHGGRIIAKEVVRHRGAFDPWTRPDLDSIISEWKTAWHGTKFQHLESILQHGLMPSGSKLPSGYTIKPPPTHFKLNETIFGIRNWANALFVSPSIPYASHPCYSERIFSENKLWCVLIKVLVNPRAYTVHEPTVLFRSAPSDGEPDTPEYRIETSPEDRILRVESARNVVVTSVVFILLNFLENLPDLTLDELNSLFDSQHQLGSDWEYARPI